MGLKMVAGWLLDAGVKGLTGVNENKFSEIICFNL